jgi:hypothetical protein
MAFSLAVEALNIRGRAKRKALALAEEQQQAAATPATGN